MAYLLVDSVRLRDDWDDVDLAVQLLHADEIETFEAVAVRSDEVEARVNPCVVEATKCNRKFPKLCKGQKQKDQTSAYLARFRLILSSSWR